MKRLRSGRRLQRVDDRAVHQAEVAGVGRDRHRRAGVDDAVEDARADALEPRSRRRASRARCRPCRRRRARRASISGMSAGGCCRSASISSTTSPRGAVDAGGERGLLAEVARQRARSARRGRVSHGATAARCASLLPSSTTTISQRSKCWRSSSLSSVSSAGRLSPLVEGGQDAADRRRPVARCQTSVVAAPVLGSGVMATAPASARIRPRTAAARGARARPGSTRGRASPRAAPRRGRRPPA